MNEPLRIHERGRTRGFAIVTKRGRIKVETICSTKDEVKSFLFREADGDTIERVYVSREDRAYGSK